MKSPIVLLAAVLNDIRRLQPDVKGIDRDIHTIDERYKHEGIGFLTIALPSFADSLHLGLSNGQFRSPLGFKSSKGSVLPRFLGGLLSNVFEPSSGLVKLDACVESVMSLRQVLMLFKKVELDECDSDKLHTQAISAFLSNDALIGNQVLDPRQEHLLGAVCRYILPSLSMTDYSQIKYKHGPGAVAENYKSNQKWLGVYNGILTDAFDTYLCGYDDFGILDRIDLSSIDPSTSSEPGDNLFTISANRSFRGSARLVTVAKNSTSRRLITIEPLLNQFVQQGLNTVLRDSISDCRVLSKCLALSDQSKNQELALEGSILLNWSTLDLKSASDLLSLQLVKSVFRHRFEFLEALIKCRTPTATLDNVQHNLLKYAGMGNATTFPIQSIVFATLAITAIVDALGKTPTLGLVERIASKHIRVYGDDIIVSTQYAHQVVNWLTSAGLIVNTKKSFLDGYFKESCGVDAYKGVDVTPLYCRFRPDNSSIEASDLERMVSFSNNAWMRGYYSLAEVVKQEVEERLGMRLPLVSATSGSLGWVSRIDAMNPHKWDSKLHRFLTKTLVSSSIKRKDSISGYAALLKFFHVPLLGRPLKHLLESSMRFKLKIAKRWVPTRVGTFKTFSIPIRGLENLNP